MKSAIAYIRVSTQRQGKSGSGLQAQQAALARFAEAEGCSLVETYQEVERRRATTRWNAVRNWRRQSRPPARRRRRSLWRSYAG